MAEKNEKVNLGKKPLWFLFLGANVVILLGCMITWFLIRDQIYNLLYLPTLICNLVAIIMAAVFIYFDIKDFAAQIMHFQKKWLKFYIVAFCCFVASILFNVLYFLFFIDKNAMELHGRLMGWELWVYFGITMFLTLVAIGFQRYARFRIDLDVYRRKHGENPNNPEPQKESEKTEKKDEISVKKSNQKDSKKSSASSGLLDQM